MAEALLIGLVEWAIRAAVLAGVVGVVLWALRVTSPHVRLTAWTLVLTGAMLMPLASQVMPPLLVALPDRLFGSQPESMPAANFLVSSDDHRPDVVATEVDTATRSRPWTSIAAGLWLAVSTFLLSRVLIGSWMASRFLRVSRYVEASWYVENGVRESDLAGVPLTVGLFRPTVVLPGDWREWDERKLSAVLAHERAHVERRDPLRQFAASVYRSLCWFHPLAWWLRAELVELAEQASDDVAIGAIGDRLGYAETLLGFIKRPPGRVRLNGVAMASRGARTRRMERILDPNHKPSCAIRARAVFALVIAAVPAVYLTAVVRPFQAVALQAAAPVCGGSDAHARWLNQDVAYIVKDEEKQNFQALGTEQQCDEFIEQFWQDRDPNPATPWNEAKEEHYRRIAYANQRFVSDIPGWKSDRGRIYILFGPPAEIESHPLGVSVRRPEEQGGGMTSAYPYEAWRYRHISGIGYDIRFDFVDSSRRGEYRLAGVRDAIGQAALKSRLPGFEGMDSEASEQFLKVNSDRTVSIYLPEDWAGDRVGVRGFIVDHAGRSVYSFEETTARTWLTPPLSPGSYLVSIVVTKAGDVQQQVELGFNVE